VDKVQTEFDDDDDDDNNLCFLTYFMCCSDLRLDKIFVQH